MDEFNCELPIYAVNPGSKDQMKQFYRPRGGQAPIDMKEYDVGKEVQKISIKRLIGLYSQELDGIMFP